MGIAGFGITRCLRSLECLVCQRRESLPRVSRRAPRWRRARFASWRRRTRPSAAEQGT